MGPTDFHIVNLARLTDHYDENPHARRLALKYREHRLLALKTNPEAFAISYEEEAKRSLSQIIDRLRNSQANYFVAVNRRFGPTHGESPSEQLDRMLEAEWMGMIVLIGPVQDPLAVISAQSEPLAQSQRWKAKTQSADPAHDGSDVTHHYHLSGTFVHPAARQEGIGKILLTEALAQAASEARQMGAAMRCTVLVDSENTAAQRLYEGAGFRVTGQETYVQQPRMQLNESVTSQRVAWHLEVVREL